MALRRCVGGETAALGLERTPWPILLLSISNDELSIQHEQEELKWRVALIFWKTVQIKQRNDHMFDACAQFLHVDMNIKQRCFKHVMSRNTEVKELWRKMGGKRAAVWKGIM